jgi:hypothetical protein
MTNIIYHDWIVEISCDPDHREETRVCWEAAGPDVHLIAEVNRALETLAPLEQDIIHLYYYSGRSLMQIARELHKPLKRIEAIHHQALLKLNQKLTPFVHNRFDIPIEIVRNCPICDSLYKDQINGLIAKKKEGETWREIIRILKSSYNIIIKTPQILIGHQKYH